MPENHVFRMQLLELEKEIYEENVQPKPLETVLDSIALLAKIHSENNSPLYFEARLNKLNFNLKAGKNFPEIEKELLGSSKNLASTIDSVSLLSLNYKSALSQLYYQTDRFALASKANNIMNKYSHKLVGSKSWEYALLLGKSIEYNLWASNYSEALQKQTEFLALEADLKKQKNSEQFLWFQFQAGKIAKSLGNVEQWKKYGLKANTLLALQSKNRLLKYSKIGEQAASIYLETSNLVKAEKILNHTLARKQTHFGKSDPFLIKNL